MSVDLPTFERPTIAISGRPVRGKSAADAAERMNWACMLGINEKGQGANILPLAPYPSTLCALVSNGVVGLDFDFGDSHFRRNRRRHRAGHRDLQDFIHVADQ